MAQDHHVTGVDLARHDRDQRALFIVEYPGGSRDARVFESGDLCNRALGGQISAQDRQVALRINGLVDRADDILICSRCARHIGQFFSEGAPCDGQAVTMYEPCVEQHFKNLWDPPRTVQVDRDVASRWF